MGFQRCVETAEGTSFQFEERDLARHGAVRTSREARARSAR